METNSEKTSKKHFVVAAIGTGGDVFPYLEIGRGVRERGYKVSAIVNPYFEKDATNHGLSFVPFGTLDHMKQALADPGIWDPKCGFRRFWTWTIRPNLQAVRQYLQTLPADEEVIVLAGTGIVAAVDLARADRPNLKIVHLYICPMYIRSYFGRVGIGEGVTLSERTPRLLRTFMWWIIDKFFMDVGVVSDINRERRRLNLSPIKRLIPHIQSAPDVYVGMFPEWFSATQPDYPAPYVAGDFPLFDPVAGPLSAELQEFLKAGPPPIVFTPGTGNLHSRKLFEAAAEVVTQLGQRAVFLTKFKEQLPDKLPPNILWQTFVALHDILPHASTIVHHGGIGTVSQATKAGVPQLVVPSAYDQFDNARIMEEFGIGRSIPMRTLDRTKLLRELSAIINSPHMQSACKKVAENFGARVDTVDRLLALV